MGLAFALYALYYWLNDKRLQDAGVFLIMAYAFASMWRQHRARRKENRGTLMT